MTTYPSDTLDALLDDLADNQLPMLAALIPTPSSVTITPRALLFDEALPYEDYEAIARALTDIFLFARRNLPFYLGDLLNEAELRYGETYAQLVEMTGMDVETLRQYKWVCGAVRADLRAKVSPRGDTLTFTHCKLVAKFDHSRQEHLLALTEQQKWSTRDLRDYIAEAYPADAPSPKPRLDWMPDTTELPASSSAAAPETISEDDQGQAASAEGIKSQLLGLLAEAFRAIGDHDWEEAADAVDSAIIVVRRMPD